MLFAGGCRVVAGVDEVGRGAWAGPVSVGVALVDRSGLERLPEGLRDSKQLSARSRELMFPALVACCLGYAVGHASAEECDELGMTGAQRLAARRALQSLEIVPDAVVVDGPYDFTGHPSAVALPRADERVRSVAAASVLAKVSRDRLLVEAAAEHPGYGFERNKGYPSPEHRHAVARLGMTPIHRRSWTFSSPPASG